jgi:hypothetical protein
MKTTLTLPVILILGILLFSAGCTQPPEKAQPSAPVSNITVPFAPVPVASEEGMNLAYELELVSAPGHVPVPETVEVLDAATGTAIETLDGELLAALFHPAFVPPPTPDELRNGTGKVPVPRVSVWLVVSPDKVPDRLTHRVTFNRTADNLPPVTVSGGEVTVRKDLAPVVVGAPFEGPGWLAMETTSPFTHHFRAQITLNGVTRVPQRFAQDWVYLDPATGYAATGNASLARNYYGFGKEIHAVADGTVVEAGDGLPDIETIYSAPPGDVSTLPGNHAIIDIGDGKYACYAHMVNGSVRVKAGDTVKEGQLIGLMGNSGNSDIPHLHFQVVTGNASFLGAEGYPHVYRSFTRTAMVNVTRATQHLGTPGYDFNRLWSEFGQYIEPYPVHEPQVRKLMENNDVVSFS